MWKFKKNTVFLLFVAALLIAGCDAGNVSDTVNKVASDTSRQIPKVKEVVDTLSNAIPQNIDTVTGTNSEAGETIANNANVTVTNPGDDEEVSGIKQNNLVADSPTSASSGIVGRITSSIRALLGSTNFRGADVDGGNLACAKVVTTALKNAGVLSRIQINCDNAVADLKAKGWVKVTAPPYKEGDVITWTRNRGPGRHIGIIVKEGSTYQAISNNSDERTPRIHDINYSPITQVLRKA